MKPTTHYEESCAWLNIGLCERDCCGCAYYLNAYEAEGQQVVAEYAMSCARALQRGKREWESVFRYHKKKVDSENKQD